MKNIWPYIASFFAGIIAGMMLMFSKVKPVINTQSYIESNEQRVGKLKQRGEGNEQTTKGEIKVSGNGEDRAVSGEKNKKELRKERRENRKLNRKNKEQ